MKITRPTPLLIGAALLVALSHGMASSAIAQEETASAGQPEEPHAPVLRIGTSPFPPFEYVQQDQILGVDTDLVKAVVADMGYTPKIEVIPWARVEIEARAGKMALIYSLTASPEREQHYWFTDPLSEAKDVLFKRKSDHITWQRLSDLDKYRMGISTSYNYAPAFMDWINSGDVRVSAVAHETPEVVNLRMLAHGRIDLFICDISVCSFFLRDLAQQFPELSRIDYIPKMVGETRHFHAAFSRRYPGSNRLYQAFNASLKRLTESGVKDAIKLRYGLKDLQVRRAPSQTVPAPHLQMPALEAAYPDV